MKVEEPMTLSKMPLMMLPAVLLLLLLLPPPSKPPNTPAIVEPVEVAEDAVEGMVEEEDDDVELEDVAVVEAAVVVVLDLVVLELVVFLVVVFLVDFLVVFFTGQLVISDKEVSFISVAKLPVALASTRAAIKNTFFIPILLILKTHIQRSLHLIL